MHDKTRCVSILALIFVITARAAAPPGQNLPADPARQLREYRDFAMGHDGNAAHGRELFNNEQRTACVKCHSVDGSSTKAGPDLLVVGDKFPRRELIRAVLEPSAEIAIGYGTTIVESKSGEEFQGIIKETTAEALELVGADGKRLRIATRDIQGQRGSTLSLMPEGLQTALSRQEFTDLIEYLVTLQQPESALTSHRGMPAIIPELARPVAVRPFFAEQMRFPHAFVQKPGDVRYGLVWFGQLPGASNTFVAAHQTGKIWLLEKNGTNETKTLFADVGKDLFNERGPNGLLSLAFHPKFGAGGSCVLPRSGRPRAGDARWLHATADRGNGGAPRIRPRPARTVQSSNVGLQQRVHERCHQTVQPGLSVCRRETRSDRNWKFWQEPHLPGTVDQQFAPGKVERCPR